VVSGLHVDTDGGSFTVANSSGSAVKEYLTFDLTVNGVRRYLYIPLYLSAGKSALIGVHFEKPVTNPIIQPCANKPIGIVEPSDPVMTVTAPPPPGT
jgi:hypothetical protein